MPFRSETEKHAALRVVESATLFCSVDSCRCGLAYAAMAVAQVRKLHRARGEREAIRWLRRERALEEEIERDDHTIAGWGTFIGFSRQEAKVVEHASYQGCGGEEEARSALAALKEIPVG